MEMTLPGMRPAGHFLTGHLGPFLRDPLGFLVSTARRFGDIVPLRFAHRRGLLISHPDLIDQVLRGERHRFEKTSAPRDGGGVFGDGLFTARGEGWRQQRRLIAPAFGPKAVPAYAARMVAEIERTTCFWRDGDILDLHAAIGSIVLSTVAQCLFGARSGPWIDDMERTMLVILERFRREFPVPWAPETLLPPGLPLPANRRLERAIRALRTLIINALSEARGSEIRTLLTEALDSRRRPGDGAALSAETERDLGVTLLLTGHDTTAAALSWTWYLLAKAPAVEARLREDLAAILRGSPPKASDLPQLVFARHIVAESLRLYPPAWGMNRVAMEDCEVGGVHMRRGMFAAMSQWVVHRDPRWYHQPENFAPDRWAQACMSSLPRFAWFPFGGGARICIGREFALQQLVLTLAALSRRFRFHLLSDRPVEPELSITMRPRGGVWVRVERAAAL